MGGKRSILLTKKEKEAIRAAVAKAESRSTGEIVTVVVEQSDRYLEAERLGALLLAALSAAIAAIATAHVTIWTYIPLVLLLYFPVLALFRRFPRLKLCFVGPARQAIAVRERAVAAFYEKGVHRTRQETGILIFISLLERKVWILADRGINQKIPPHSWNELAAELAAGLREGRVAEALGHAIDACGDQLALHFPRQGADTNELSDEILTS